MVLGTGLITAFHVVAQPPHLFAMAAAGQLAVAMEVPGN